MEFKIKTGSFLTQNSDCLIVGVCENNKLLENAKALDKHSKKHLSTVLKKGDLSGKPGETLLLHNIPNLSAERVILLGCGPTSEIKPSTLKKIITGLMTTLKSTGASNALLCVADFTVEQHSLAWVVKQIVQETVKSCYQFEQFKTQNKAQTISLKSITFAFPDKKGTAEAKQAILEGKAIATGIAFTKNLGNTPPNVCTPIYLAKEAEKLAKKYPKLKTKSLDTKDMKALKMGAFLSVAQGSENPPRLITIEYRGQKATQKPIVLVGKGITFDTGGNSLKPAMSMIGMKYDMCGAASVFGVMEAVAQLDLPLNIVGVVAAAENMPGSTATRPEDIVTTMSGQTVEILNTDAEGRLVLCDSLTYCERFKPEVVIDMATLTGACVVALSSHASAVLGNHQPLINDLLAAGENSQDRCWQLPLWDEYQDTIKSEFADIANIASPPFAGTITAACFLSRFTKQYQWAHLDIAGSAFQSTGPSRGATGRPVALLVQYLLDRCA